MSEEVKSMIGCLCWFGYRNTVGLGHRRCGILKDIQVQNNKTYYICDNDDWYDKCQPVKPEEVRFVSISKTIDHIGDTNEMDELVKKMHKLQEEIKKLEDVKHNIEVFRLNSKIINKLDDENKKIARDLGDVK